VQHRGDRTPQPLVARILIDALAPHLGQAVAAQRDRQVELAQPVTLRSFSRACSATTRLTSIPRSDIGAQ
jgi:hypothetical protein